MNAKNELLLSRWNASWDAKYAPRKDTFENAVRMTLAPSHQLGEITKSASGRLTEQGVREELRKVLGKDSVLGRLKRDKAAITAAREALARERAALGQFRYDKTDLVAAMHRREIREHIKGLPQAEQSALLLTDASVREAVYEVPRMLSGLTQIEYDRWREHHVEVTFGPQLEAINDQSSMLELVGVAIDLAIDTAKRESGLATHQANAWVDGIAA